MLYVVATPIGNLEDMSQRGLTALRQASAIAAEDTRRTARLLSEFGIDTQVIACHSHNEAEVAGPLLDRLRQGEDIALVSDAGTPLLSDPGYHLVDACHAEGIPVAPVPGPSSLTAALSVAGLPVARFAFEGFLPAKSGQRLALLEALVGEPRTMVFFEAPHRVVDSLMDVGAVLGTDRRITVCRELTKRFEQIVRGTVAEVCRQMQGEIPSRGEFVLLVAGSSAQPSSLDELRLLKELVKALPPSKAAAIAAKVTGGNRGDLYELAVKM